MPLASLKARLLQLSQGWERDETEGGWGEASRVVRALPGVIHSRELLGTSGREWCPAVCQLVFHRLHRTESAGPGNYFTSIISPKSPAANEENNVGV